jgi:cytochrome c biogenesis protein CcdA
MAAWWNRFRALLRRLVGGIVRVVQAVLLAVLLFLVYVVGVGLTVLAAALFDRRLLRGQRRDDESFWVDARGYEARVENVARQS